MDFETIVDGFESTLLRDMQYGEGDDACMEDREERSIDELGEGTRESIEALVQATMAAIPAKLWDHFNALWVEHYRYNEQYDAASSFGSDLYMVAVGHGAGIWDRSIEGDKDYKLVTLISDLAREAMGHIEFYTGDDGRVYCC